MEKVEKEDFQELERIIKKKDIRTVFQPIISLKDDYILGYEALTRGPADTKFESPVTLFSTARKYRMLFELEKVCREKALLTASKMKNSYKLFFKC